MIGIQCILMGGILFPPIYWQTACLLQRAGAIDRKSPDYNKIAKAISSLTKQGVKILPISINHSEENFVLDEEKNIIYFGFFGMKGVKAKVIDSIVKNRPFFSLQDFVEKANPDILSLVNLIKAGAFDEFGTRESQIQIFLELKADTKKKLDGKNLGLIAREGLWPQNTAELEKSYHCYNFGLYLKILEKKNKNVDYPKTEFFILDDRAKDYLDRNDIPYEDDFLEKCVWKTWSNTNMIYIKRYIAENQERLLERVNSKVINSLRDQYFPPEETYSQWEIATLGICFHEHPMTHFVLKSDFDDLPTDPAIDKVLFLKGRSVPLYKISCLPGVVIAKDKLHSSFTILTAKGPVEVKLRKQVFAHYDAQISKKIDGKKKVIEKSWLNRGTMVLVSGMRRDDQFIGKFYRSSKMNHEIYKITEIVDGKRFKVQKERKVGEKSESDSED